uniref:Uncharacterized protein n=1 Tax=Tetranychus urticae TaxID=32264 RepID=T1KEV4_TETUR
MNFSAYSMDILPSHLESLQMSSIDRY